jgi:hypothetical protein
MPSMRAGRAIGSSQAFGDAVSDSWPSERRPVSCCAPIPTNATAAPALLAGASIGKGGLPDDDERAPFLRLGHDVKKVKA